MTLLVLLSQIATDPLSGGAGWVGTGLLGSVLGWLLFVHLPNKDKQVTGLVESRDKLVEKLTGDFRQSLTDLVSKSESKDSERRADFKESLKTVTDHCEKEVSKTVDALKQEVDRISKYVGDISQAISTAKKGE